MIIGLLLHLMCLTYCYGGTVVSKTRTSSLEQYESYINAVILRFDIPHDTLFASFKFVASEHELSIFGCQPRDVSLYMKHGSSPVINPDGATFPKSFRNLTRPKIYNLEFKTDEVENYINLTSPEPGSYFAATFLSYSDPRYNPIKQEGLTPTCYAFVESSLYVERINFPTIVSENSVVDAITRSNESRYFTFYAYDTVDHVILSMRSISLADNADSLIMRVQVNKPPSNESYLTQKVFHKGMSQNITSADVIFWTEPESWYYLEFYTENNDGEDLQSSFQFTIRFFSNRLSSTLFQYQQVSNVTLFNTSATTRTFNNNRLIDIQPYNQYDLVRDSSTDSFTFTYQLEEEMQSNVIVPINVTNKHFSVFKFRIRESLDIGGTLQYTLAFKPRLIREKSTIRLEEEPDDNTIIGCIQNMNIPVPTWPNKCVTHGVSSSAHLILNNTVTNATILVPYPESGNWYASFKLVCGPCEPCNCSETCQNNYVTCVTECELNSTTSVDSCAETCSNETIAMEECSGCDCDGPCRNDPNVTCNSSIIFDISSRPCYYGDCGKNGRCMFMVSEGTVYSTCVCMNKYKGFDCSDGSDATVFYLVVIELVLLVLSNLFFLPSVYVAYQRRYYVECLSYFAICFFSTFYHACDAGENLISYCLVRLSALQFADFFCALLAIWLTLLAIADLPPTFVSLLQMGGAIVLAVCTTINKTSFWVFGLAACGGIAVVAISWYLKYRKFKQRFISRNYLYVNLPIGFLIVTLGLVIYALLQTESNYKYLHSMWHVIMATAVVILLPKKNTFQPEVLL